MRLDFTKRPDDPVTFSILYTVLCLLAIAACRLLSAQGLAPECVFRGITGIPCPTCGSTRALAFLSYGKLTAAFALNPLMVFAVILIPLFSVYRIVTRIFTLPHMQLFLHKHERKWLAGAATICLLAQWIYLLHAL